MADDTKQQFDTLYETGMQALERGQYRCSVENLEKALELYPINTKIGGEASIGLITAYQGVGKIREALALCRQLASHPNPSLKDKGKRLLYILEAPRLQRPPEWMTPIPNLESSETKPQYMQVKTKTRTVSNPGYQIESVDLSKINTKENGFIWLALIALILTIGGVIFLH